MDGAGVPGPAADGAVLAIELCGPSWVQSGQAAQDGEGGETVERQREERGETPPHPCGCGPGGGAGMRKHGDPVYEGFLRPLRRGLPGRSHRRASQRWG